MFFRLLFLLSIIPITEVYFLFRLSEGIGWNNTILVILGTAFIGAWLLRRQGASIFQKIQQSASQNQLPSEAIARGFFTFVGGLLLLTPGLLTDAIGLSLIFPLTQSFWKNYFMKQWQTGINSGRIHVVTRSSGFSRQPPFGAPHTSRTDAPPRFDSDVIDINAKKSQTTEKKDS